MSIKAMISRRGALAGLLVFVAGPALAKRPKARAKVAAPSSPMTDLAGRISAARLGSAEVVYALAPVAGAIVASRGPDMPVPPASCAKTLTTLFALEHLGPEFRFRTRVMALGRVTGGRVEGDLLLVGGGDPTMDTDRMGDLVKALADKGITKVTGRFIAVTGAIPERARLVDDQPDHVGYNPSISGLNLNFNRIYFEWKRGGKGWTRWVGAYGDRYRVEVATSAVEIAARDAPLFTYASKGGQDQWTVAATALNDDGSRWLPVRDSGAYAAECFRQLARAHGLTLPPATVVSALPDGAVELVGQDSDDLAAVLKDMLKFSTNLTAEVVGLTATRAATPEESARVVAAWLKSAMGVNVDIHDHSGLNGSNRVTAAQMLNVMQAATRLPKGAMLEGLMREKGLPAADGQDSDNASIRVHAKSGTMNFVSGLVGYIRDGDKALAFAMFEADVARRQAVPLTQREDPEGGSGWLKRARGLQAQMLRAFADEWL